jgi:hypothetical protein
MTTMFQQLLRKLFGPAHPAARVWADSDDCEAYDEHVDGLALPRGDFRGSAAMDLRLNGPREFSETLPGYSISHAARGASCRD